MARRSIRTQTAGGCLPQHPPSRFTPAGAGLPGMPRPRATALAALALLVLAGCQTTGENQAPGTLSLNARLRLAEATDAQQGGSAATLSVLTEAATEAPTDVALQDRLAAVAEANERWDVAVAAHRRAIARAPTQERLMRLGRIELRLAQASAVETWRRAVATGPRTAEALTGLGLAQDLARDHAAAQASYREALESDPTNWSATANLGMSLLLTGQATAAIDVLSRAEADASAPARARHNLAIAFAVSGQEARMLRVLRADTTQTPQQRDALSADIRAFAQWLSSRDRVAATADGGAGAGAQVPPAATQATAAVPPATATRADLPPAASPPVAVRAPATPPAAAPAPAAPPAASAAAVIAPAATAQVPAAAAPPGIGERPPGPVVSMDPIINPRDPQATTTAAAPAAPPAAQGGSVIQVGALDSEAAAQRQWAALTGRVAGLDAHTPSIERHEVNGRTVWRLQVRGLATTDGAALCGRVRAAGGACFVSR
jgi:Flp pilus assembly protein TadD